MKLAAIDTFTMTTDIKNMFIVAEFPTAYNVMEFFRPPMQFSVGGIGSVLWTDIWKKGVGMMK